MLLSLLLLFSWSPAAQAQGRGGVVRIGMTAADIPYTPGQPDQGGEGYRFIGYQMYDALINWDLSQGDRLPDLVPGLAESWKVSQADNTRWIFHLRRGVTFHDGSHVGESTHPVFGEAHGNALTNSETYALRRAAINLGDQFGLSLYNKGSLEAIVRWTLVRPEQAADPGVKGRREGAVGHQRRIGRRQAARHAADRTHQPAVGHG